MGAKVDKDKKKVSVQSSQELDTIENEIHKFGDFIPEALIILNDLMNIVYVNSASENLFGYSSGEVIGKSIDVFLHEISSNSHRIQKSKFIDKEKEKNSNIENRLLFGRHKDGHIIPLDMSLSIKTWANVDYFVCMPRDLNNQITYQEAVNNSEVQFRNIFQEHNAVMLMVEPTNGKILEANKSASVFYGYSREHLISMTIDQINTLSSEALFNERAKALVHQNNCFHFQHRLASGDVRDVEVYSTPINSNGKIFLFSIIHDITERNVTDNNLHQVANRLLLATQAGNLGIWDWDVVNDKLIWDEKMYQLYGITQENFNGAYEAWQMGLHQEDKARGDLEIQWALQGKKEFDIEFRVVWPNGNIRTLRGNALVQRDDAGQPVHMIGTNWDVTEQKNIDDELSNKISLLSALLNSLPDIVFFKDKNGIYLGCNDAFANFAGKPVDEIINKSDFDLFQNDIATTFREHDQNMMMSGANRQNEEWIDFPDGKRILVDTLKTPLYDSKRNVIGVLGVSRDITQRKILEEITLIERNFALLLTQKSSLQEALPIILDLALEVSEMDSGGIYLIDPQSQDMVLAAHKGLSEEFVSQSLIYHFDSDRFTFIKQGKPSYLPINQYPLNINENISREGLLTLGIIPVIFESQVIACINIASHTISDIPELRQKAIENLSVNLGNMIARFLIQDDLIENQRQLKSMFDSIQDFVFVLDGQGNILQVNPKVLKILGYSSEELIGKSVLQLHPVDQREKAWMIVSDMLEGKVDSCPLNLLTKDGDQIPVETKFNYGRWGNQDVLIGISRDITERNVHEREQQKQRKLLEYRNNFEEILTNISTKFINLEPQKIGLEINQVLQKIGEFEQVDRSYLFIFDEKSDRVSNTHEWCASGIQPQIDDLQNLPAATIPWWMEKLKNFKEVYIPVVSDLPSEAQSEKEILEAQSIQSVLVVPLVMNNSLLGFIGFDSVSQPRIWTDDSILLIKMVGDILSNALSHEHMVEQLTQNEIRTKALLSAVPDLIFRIREDGTLLDFKNGAQNSFDVPSDIVLGSSLTDVFGEEPAIKLMTAIDDATKKKEIQTLEFEFKESDAVRILEARIIESGKNEVTTIIRDVSDRARLEQMKSDFINRATHELRTPIATMLLMANLIDGDISQAEFKEYWDVMKSELSRERLLVEDLLCAGRMENGILQLQISNFNLEALIDEVIHQAEISARDKKLSIVLNIKKETETISNFINADEKKITQVMVNLLGNAIKFSPSGGKIEILVEMLNSGTIIAISDNGIGIPSEDIPLLFTRFFRGTNAIEEEIPGTGIGLFIVKSIVEKHNGTLKVNSVLGKGSQFQISLPNIANNK
jgi:PAS domain S-box-containing protein